MSHVFADNEFSQLMKGLQGERLRQAFKYFDKDEDGFIRPEQFKRIIMVRDSYNPSLPPLTCLVPGNCRPQTLGCHYREAADSVHVDTRRPYHLL